MFKALKNNKIIAVSDLDRFKCMVFDVVEEDKEHIVDDFVCVGDEYVLKTDGAGIEFQKELMRGIRNSYLEQFVDPKQLVLIWADLSETEKEDCSNYRRYLLDYTLQENWWKQQPKTFEEWKGE